MAMLIFHISPTSRELLFWSGDEEMLPAKNCTLFLISLGSLGPRYLRVGSLIAALHP